MIDNGIKSYNHYRNEKKYNLALIYVIVSTIISVAFAISYIAIGANFAAYTQFLGAFVFMLLVGLLRRRIQILTRYIAILTSLSLIVIQSVWLFGNSFGFQHRVYPLIVIVFLLLDFNVKHEKISAYIISVLCVGTFFISSNLYLPVEPIAILIYSDYYMIVNVLLSFVGSMFMLHYISDEIFSSKDQLYQMATRDTLTGLFNRRTFIQQATSFFKIAQRGGSPFTILILDIDNFKSVNDLYGHAAGDHYLKGISKLYEETLRDSDFVARYGGEEFAVVLHDVDEEQALLVAEKLRKAVEAYKIKDGAIFINRTISIGLVSYSHKFNYFHEIMDKGDKAMYMSKNNGKNKVSVINIEKEHTC